GSTFAVAANSAFSNTMKSKPMSVVIRNPIKQMVPLKKVVSAVTSDGINKNYYPCSPSIKNCQRKVESSLDKTRSQNKRNDYVNKIKRRQKKNEAHQFF
ncbi:7306_t:CDS:1, partial [Gigaspora rosea]